MSNERSYTLTDNQSGESWELPVMHGSLGPDVIDVRKLYAQTGCFTYDPGFTSTGSCESKITFIDGDEGGFAVSRLSYRTASRALRLHGGLLPAFVREPADGCRQEKVRA